MFVGGGGIGRFLIGGSGAFFGVLDGFFGDVEGGLFSGDVDLAGLGCFLGFVAGLIDEGEVLLEFRGFGGGFFLHGGQLFLGGGHFLFEGGLLTEGGFLSGLGGGHGRLQRGLEGFGFFAAGGEFGGDFGGGFSLSGLGFAQAQGQ